MPPIVNRARCDGCGICVFECGVHVFGMILDKDVAYPANPKACVDCFICEVACPEDAIRIKVVKGREATFWY
ncbi:MAG TPA: ferredoxin family protein [Nitrososphaerales archaeon]|nr:ferredoxin family protein [Nitrososphaerales archaeon]